MPENSHMYEIVPVDPLSKLQKKNDSIEEDIKEIKSALRGTVGISKLESNADAFIQRMLDLMASSQKMVEQVADSNQKVVTKIQAAIDHMNQANRDLSAKLAKILNFFATATDAMGGDEDSEDNADSLNAIKASMANLAEQTARSNKILAAIERNLKQPRQLRRPQMPQMPRAPMGQPAMPPAPAAPGQAQARRDHREGEQQA